MSAVAELSDALAGIGERVGPAVVGLGRGWGVGSGVVIGEGRVLTNAHNLRRDEVGVTIWSTREPCASSIWRSCARNPTGR